MNKGKRLADLIRAGRADAPEKNAALLEAAANMLYEGIYSFTFGGWADELKGRHTERVMIFEVKVVAG